MISIVDCPCGNPSPHKKFQVEIGGMAYLTDGFFTIAEGRIILSGLSKAGLITDNDVKAIEPNLVSCSLAKSPTCPEDELRELAITLATGVDTEGQEKLLAELLQNEVLSEKEAEQVRDFIREIETILESTAPPAE